MSNKSQIHRLKIEFLEYLEVEKNRSSKTVQNYDFYLTRFISETGVRSAADITLPKVKRFRVWLNRMANERNLTGTLSKRTQNYHIIALRSFLKYLAKMDVLSLAPEKIELAKEGQRQVEFLEEDELERIVAAPLFDKQGEAVTKPGLIQIRDKALMELLFSTGLRVSEAAGLRREQIHVKRDEFTVRGKGSKLRVVFLNDRARNWLKRYLDARGDTSMYVFVSHDRAKAKGRRKEEDKPLSPRSIERLVEKYARQAGIVKKVGPHTIRHSFATDLLRNGADIRSVQAMLGHASITTTQVYTHVTDKGLREAHKKFHGKGRKNQ
ncbi:MAG: tyrosine-type recombinase/integrase [Candidatus Kerfeldbacteria bacterium]|nr:tyrosine-type recombinase/integrase [Candidatus Kerfeldbacteria bacterium]